jgi:hypothetical protein
MRERERERERMSLRKSLRDTYSPSPPRGGPGRGQRRAGEGL